jgi:hypothetical protein
MHFIVPNPLNHVAIKQNQVTKFYYAFKACIAELDTPKAECSTRHPLLFLELTQTDVRVGAAIVPGYRVHQVCEH